MAITSPTAPIKRRRKVNQGESSREASAESNDESETTENEDDEDEAFNSIASSSVSLNKGPRLTTRESFEAVNRNGDVGYGGRRPSNGIIPVAELIKVDLNDSEGSAGHDGDVSSANASIRRPHPSSSPTRSRHPLAFPPSTTGSLIPLAPVLQSQPSYFADSSTPPSPRGSPIASRHPGHGGLDKPTAWAAAPTGFLSSLTPEEIQEHIRTAIATLDPNRSYRIMEPPVGRPVRIYADGVYDLLHYGHMLQLRQCKLAFPDVYLMVGVCAGSLVRQHKASPVLTSAERYESVRHCKWVDEVVENAPWVIDGAFLEKWGIDYVAHDEEPYQSSGVDDVYNYVKSIGAFLPTKRTNGVSTSELLQRIVEGYREGEYDSKFIKLGLPDLCSTRNASEAGTSGSKGKEDNGLEEVDV